MPRQMSSSCRLGKWGWTERRPGHKRRSSPRWPRGLPHTHPTATDCSPRSPGHTATASTSPERSPTRIRSAGPARVSARTAVVDVARHVVDHDLSEIHRRCAHDCLRRRPLLSVLQNGHRVSARWDVVDLEGTSCAGVDVERAARHVDEKAGVVAAGASQLTDDRAGRRARSRRSRRSYWSLRPDRALRSDRSNGPHRTLRSRRSNRSRGTNGSCRTLRTSRALRSRRAGWSSWSGRSGWAGRSRWPGRSCRSRGSCGSRGS